MFNYIIEIIREIEDMQDSMIAETIIIMERPVNFPSRNDSLETGRLRVK